MEQIFVHIVYIHAHVSNRACPFNGVAHDFCDGYLHLALDCYSQVTVHYSITAKNIKTNTAVAVTV